MTDLLSTIGEAAIGFVVGTLSGLLGVGGGVLLVPTMVLGLNVDQLVAQGVSLVVIIPTSVVGAITHYRNGNVLPKLALAIGIAALVGATAGVELSQVLDSDTLRRLFGVLMVAVAIRMLATSLRPARPKEPVKS